MFCIIRDMLTVKKLQIFVWVVALVIMPVVYTLIVAVGSSLPVSADHERVCNFEDSNDPDTKTYRLVDKDASCPELPGYDLYDDLYDPDDDHSDGAGAGCTFTPRQCSDSSGAIWTPGNLPPDENASEIDTYVGTEICEDVDGESVCDCDDDSGDLDASNCGIVRYINIGINILAGAAGLAIVGGLMVSGYMYMTARDNPGQVAAARIRAIWALAALLLLIFGYGALNFLVPGGVL